MTELIAYRYKQRAADGRHSTNWTPWRSGRLRAEMMTELRAIGGNALTIVQCAVPLNEPDEINGRENDLWIWTRSSGWKKSNARNWFVDSCDPTHRYDDDDADEPFGSPRPSPQGNRGVENITSAIENDEITSEDDTPPNCVTGKPAEEFPSIHGGDIPNEGFVKNKFVDSIQFSIEGKIG